MRLLPVRTGSLCICAYLEPGADPEESCLQEGTLCLQDGTLCLEIRRLAAYCYLPWLPAPYTSGSGSGCRM